MSALPPSLKLIARALLALGFLFCMVLITGRAVAEWHARSLSADGFRRAIRWDPGNPSHYADLARTLQTSLEGADLDEVIHLYEKASQLSPHQARYWAELGGVYELAGRLDEAQRAYERAQQLFPNSGRINWQLGNFYIRRGRLEEALQAFHKVLLSDPTLRMQAYDLATRAGAEPQRILREMLSRDLDVLFGYLHYVIGKNQMDAAEAVWAHILAHDLAFEPRLAFPYLDALVAHKRITSLSAAWTALTDRNSSSIRHRSFEPNLITNGGFEDAILDGGLDWRIQPVEGVVVSVDTLTFFDGTRALKIYFDGQHNLDYKHIYQLVPVRPNVSYRFSAYMRAQGITTDSGPRFVLHDAYDTSRLHLATEGVVGSSGWAPVQLVFRIGPETELLAVRVVRSTSGRIDNRIAGVAWLDRVSLVALE